MNIYVLNLSLVLLQLFIGTIFFRSRTDHTNFKASAVVFFLMLFLEFALMGDWSTDIRQYYMNFKVNYGTLRELTLLPAFQDLLQIKGIGFVVLSLIVKYLTGNFMHLLIILGIVIAFCYVSFIYKYSELTWMSMLVLLCSGCYYYSFNLVRQILAASLFCCCFYSLYQGKWKRYFLSVLGIMLFHFSAVVLIPLYFLLRADFSKVKQTVFFCYSTVAAVYLFTPQITNFVTSFFYENYRNTNAYGMSEGLSLFSACKSLALGLVVLLNYKKFNYQDEKEKVIFNGCFVYLLFGAASFRIKMLYRFVNFFVPFLMLAYPMIANRGKNRSLSLGMSGLFLIILHSNWTFYAKYYFFWENTLCYWSLVS
ncbi:MAG: EpsG family protein [Lachnospiraceae bacterium]|nr:EpsG family protein [Lachnospiraceae bacterium]